MSLFTSIVRRAAIGAALLISCGPVAAARCLSAIGIGVPFMPGAAAYVEHTAKKSEPKPAKPKQIESRASQVNQKEAPATTAEEHANDQEVTPPKCAPALLLSDINNAELFLNQAMATASLSPETGVSLRDALQRFTDLEQARQNVLNGSRCDAAAPAPDTPVGTEDVPALLAVASHYLLRAGKEAEAAGLSAQFGENLQAAMRDIQTARNNLASKDQPQPETGKTLEIILGITALVFLLALSVAFWYPQIAKLAKQLKVLSGSLKELDSEHSRAQSELSSLRGKFRALEATIEQHEAGMKQFEADPNEDKEQKIREMALEQTVVKARRDPQPSDGLVSMETNPVERNVASPAPAPVRDPVADYNHTRELKASDRVERFRGLYPTQRKLECVNSSARMSADPTKIRLKDDPLGNLLAVVEGQKALIFPNLTYGYDSGRNSLEGVFAYPPDGVASSRVVQAAVAEREGEEWRLQTRGQFGG